MKPFPNRPMSLLTTANLAVWLSVCATAAAEQPNPPVLDTQLKPFASLLGKTWKADFKDSTPEKPKMDIMSWERILNGKAVRVMHSINNGEYGGETIITWDEPSKSVVYTYYTTAGYKTSGTMKQEDGKIVTHETVQGAAAGGVTEVKAVMEFLPDGSYHNKSTYLKNGEWVPGHEFHYFEAPNAKVIFK